MTYAESTAHLSSLGQELVVPAGEERRKFDLAHMRSLMAALGDPQKDVAAVLIAGTNGKGSTAATLASIATAAGYRTGLYTSPHLSRVNERIQLSRAALPPEYGSAEIHGADGPLTLVHIPDDTFATLYSRVWAASQTLVEGGRLPYAPSFFELLTALAFCYFSESRAELMVLEVGLGGRLDATNIVEPLLSVITDISLDHQDYLGSTLAEITREKCGILRTGGTLITLPQHAEVNQAIGEAAMALQVRGISAADYVPAAHRGDVRAEALDRPYPVYLEDGQQLVIDTPLRGQHQQRNVALALAAALQLRKFYGFKIGNEAIANGVRETVWPGRQEHLGDGVLLDVAHNPAGAWTLRSALAGYPEQQPRTLVFSCLRDKDLNEMARILFPLFDSSLDGDPARRRDHIVFATINSSRAAKMVDLVEAARMLRIPSIVSSSVSGAVEEARRLTPPGGLIVVTGSVYLVGEAREFILRNGLGVSGAKLSTTELSQV